MDLSQNPNQSPLFCKWVGELPRPVQASLSPFVVQLFPSASGTFHPPACLSQFAGNLSAPVSDCDTLLLPVYSSPFLLCAFRLLPEINVHHSCALLKMGCVQKFL